MTLIYNMIFYLPWPSHTCIFSFGLIASSLCCVYPRRRSRTRGQMCDQATTPGFSLEPPLTAFNTRISHPTPIDSSTGTTIHAPLAPSQPPESYYGIELSSTFLFRQICFFFILPIASLSSSVELKKLIYISCPRSL